ncbi:SDR family NAD(P)-dependent oxidoreductase [Saccharopolyspora sp. NPDC002376]
MSSLAGKVALVTGAGQGVGQGIALALAGEGASVAVTGRTEAKLSATCALIRERGGQAEPFLIDVTDTTAIPPSSSNPSRSAASASAKPTSDVRSWPSSARTCAT